LPGVMSSGKIVAEMINGKWQMMNWMEKLMNGKIEKWMSEM
jgi:hypothetical protein